jgi:Cytochrome P450
VARDAEGRAWSDDEILSNLLTMLVAGEDTTAHTMAWMLHFMTDVPAVQQAMQQEADAVLGAARMLPDVQAQDQLPYIDAVAQETMRLKSVAPLLFVEPTQSVDLGGIHLLAGTAVFLLTRYGGLHEDAFPDAGQFQLARWLTAPLEPRSGPTPPGLVPFGGGPRVCPGRVLAWAHPPRTARHGALAGRGARSVVPGATTGGETTWGGRCAPACPTARRPRTPPLKRPAGLSTRGRQPRYRCHGVWQTGGAAPRRGTRPTRRR